MIGMKMQKEIDDQLQRLTGEYVWSVKRGHGTFLTMEFGNPHLIVREPIEPTGGTATVASILRRRNVSIVGDWSLWVRDSHWSISRKDAAANLDSSEAIVHEMLQNLDGQKVCAIRVGDGVVLEFDLGAILRLGKSIFPDDPTSVLWTLERFEGSNTSLLQNAQPCQIVVRRADGWDHYFGHCCRFCLLACCCLPQALPARSSMCRHRLTKP
jgi:hypothetical protein